MENLERNSVIGLEDGKLYSVVDTFNMNSSLYIFLTCLNEDKVYFLKQEIDKEGNSFLASISNEETNNLLNQIYTTYTYEGIFKEGKLDEKELMSYINSSIKKSDFKIDEKINKKVEKLDYAKQLLIEYNSEMKEYKSLNNRLEKNNEILKNELEKIPKFIRKIFLKKYNNLLDDK